MDVVKHLWCNFQHKHIFSNWRYFSLPFFLQMFVFSMSLSYNLIDDNANQVSLIKAKCTSSRLWQFKYEDSKYEVNSAQRWCWSVWKPSLYFCDLLWHLCIWVRFETVAQEILRSRWAHVKLAVVKFGKMSEFVGQWFDNSSSEVRAFGFFSQLWCRLALFWISAF